MKGQQEIFAPVGKPAQPIAYAHRHTTLGFHCAYPPSLVVSYLT